MTEPLHLFDSLSRSIRPFVPIEPGKAKVYSCGPTVYNYAHLGNLRAYVFTDTLRRVLEWKGYAVSHVINITDVGHLTSDADAGEDKMERAAAGTGRTIWDIAAHYTAAFKANLRDLNITDPTEWTVATDYVPRMIDFARKIAPTHCYELDSGLYFDISTVAGYGALAGGRDDAANARIDPVVGKRNPSDFAIWRKSPKGSRQMEWDSPWGWGAPGWHLECSVMSEAVLGHPFDIHTGGIDHREIHHPNEIAQNQAYCGCTDTGARLWMHNNFLVDRTGKMSKSSGQFLTLQAVIDRGIHPLAYRLMCLQTHYRGEMEFTWEGLASSVRRLQRVVVAARRIRPDTHEWALLRGLFLNYENSKATGIEFITTAASPALRLYLERFDRAVSRDLATPEALTVLESLLKDGSLSKRDKGRGLALMDTVLGFGLLSLTRRRLRTPRAKVSSRIPVQSLDIDALVRTRRLLKLAGEYEQADALRTFIGTLGVEVMDGDALGWDWKLDLN